MTRFFTFGSNNNNRRQASAKARAVATLRRAAVEALEQRQLLTATITPVGLPNNSAITIAAGQAVHMHGLQSTLPAGTDQIEARYKWEFGDTNGRFNTLEGFNASHAYDTAGTYQVKLSIYDENGNFHDDQVVTVTVNPNFGAGEKVVYVDHLNGRDTTIDNQPNYGTSQSTPIKTLGRAADILKESAYQHDTKIFFRRGTGQVYANSGKTLFTNYSNVLIGAWGSEDEPPVLQLSGVPGITAGTLTNGLTVHDLEFDSADPAALVKGIVLRGQKIVVRDCVFRKLTYGMTTELGAYGVLVQDNDVPEDDELRNYLTWGEGSDHTYVGNYVANTTIDHPFRTKRRATGPDNTEFVITLDRLLIAHNELHNPPLGGTDSKGATIALKDVRNAYVFRNDLFDGTLQIGADNSTTTENVVADGNYVEHKYNVSASTPHINVEAGTRHIMVRNNVVRLTGGTMHRCIQVNGEGEDRGEDGTLPPTTVFTDDVRIINNTGILESDGGSFFYLHRPGNNIQLLNNLTVSPQLVNALSVQVGEPNGAGATMSSFSAIDGNVWAPRKGTLGTGDHPEVVARIKADYKRIGDWNALTQVDTDHRMDIHLDSAYKPMSNDANVAPRRTGAPLDRYGVARPAGDVTAGAVQRDGTPPPPPPPPPGVVFLQDGAGLVSVEAESFHEHVGAGEKNWTSYTGTSGFSGAGALEASPNTGVQTETSQLANSPRLDYEVQFNRTGVHYVWLRNSSTSNSDDSAHVGLDFVAPSTSDKIQGGDAAWVWSNATMDGPVATINVTSTGVHTINVWMREDGFRFDKLVVTSDSAYVPTGTGPAESARSGLVSNVSANSVGEYTLDASGLAAGKTAFTDRSYTYSSVPASIAGGEFIKTANDDKASTDLLLSFDLAATADVYVVYDTRATTLPTWLTSWSNTGEIVTLSNGDTFRVFKKQFAAGRVTLGGNMAGGGSGAGNNYTVVVK